MKAGMASMLDMARYDRMDAEFHLSLNNVKTQLSALEASMSVPTVLAYVTAKDTASLACLKPLLRGSAKGRQELLKAAQEYPYIAYALLKKAETQ